MGKPAQSDCSRAVKPAAPLPATSVSPVLGLMRASTLSGRPTTPYNQAPEARSVWRASGANGGFVGAAFFVVVAIPVVLAIIALAAGAWLWRSLEVEIAEDDQSSHQPCYQVRRPMARIWERILIKQRPRMLTYRRDRLGRFRRHRR
jgi:hypothetical protein